MYEREEPQKVFNLIILLSSGSYSRPRTLIISLIQMFDLEIFAFEFKLDSYMFVFLLEFTKLMGEGTLARKSRKDVSRQRRAFFTLQCIFAIHKNISQK
jgi:hypothetical protein